MLNKKNVAVRQKVVHSLSLAERFIRDRFSSVYKAIELYHETFPDKPRFVFFDDGRGNVFVAREDCREQIERTKYDLGRQVTISEYDLVRYYDDEPSGYHVTMHNVWVNEGTGIVAKLGNPYRDRAPQEFMFALKTKYFRGLVELEVPLGFMVNMEHPDSTQEEGKAYVYYPGQREPEYTRMFYKYIKGRSLDHLLKEKKIEELNWILWEIAKLFSRLISFKILFKDPHRWNNYYIETNGHNQEVLRLFDCEFIIPKEEISQLELEQMLYVFLEEALKVGFIDASRLDDFLMVCLGDAVKVRDIRRYLQIRKLERREEQLDLWRRRDVF